MLVYLAGPITGLGYQEATSWRDYATEVLGTADITSLSPLRAKDYLKTEKCLADAYVNVLSTGKGILCRDYWDCNRCDVVLVNVLGAHKVSIGTVLELGWAYAAKKPIVLCIEPGNPHDHAMIREMAGFTVSCLADGLAVVMALNG